MIRMIREKGVMHMELRSRLLFVDTNIYEGKNFQFLTHSLGALKSLVDLGEVHLLVTEVTKGEVISHMTKKAAEAVAELKKIKKSAMILRNAPDISAHGIFSEVSADEVTKILVDSFETFLSSENVETVSIDHVKPSYVFNRYFSSQPPFAVGEKEKEFADAFVLKALDDLSARRGHTIHIISNDKDMAKFADEHTRLVCSDSIDAFIDAVNKSVSIEPSAFAVQALERAMSDVMQLIGGCLKDTEEDFHLDSWNTELDGVDFSGIELVSTDLISVGSEECSYEIRFKFVAEVTETEKDYDRSPFDREDDSYPFVLENLITRKYDAQASMHITISYQDKLIDSVSVTDYEPPTRLKLSAPYDQEIRYLDINGD